jgi:hypothetical protein
VFEYHALLEMGAYTELKVGLRDETILSSEKRHNKAWLSKIDKAREWGIHPVPKPFCVHAALVFFFPNLLVELRSP